MFARIGRFAADHAKVVLAVTLVLLMGAGALGFTAFDKLKSQGFNDPDAESTQAAELIARNFGPAPGLLFLVTAKDGTVDDEAVAKAGAELAGRLADDKRVSGTISYWQTKSPAMKSDDGKYALIATHAVEDTERVADQYRGDLEKITVTAGGQAVVGRDITDQVSKDLVVAESIAVPLIAIMLLVVFGSAVAALLPLVIGGIAILGTFAELSVIGGLTDVSVFAINLTTAMGLGLAIDYALLMVSRFREEMEDHDPTTAVVRTVQTAGRTIVFSAATVAVALSVLLLFPQYFLRSFAYAGIGVIMIAAVGAIVVLPALLKVLGPTVNAGRLRKRTPSPVSAFWGRVVNATMARPLVAAVPVLVLFLLAATPLLNVQFGTPDDRVLTTAAPSRIVGDALREHFPNDSSKAIDIITTGATHADEIKALPGVATVSEIPGSGVTRVVVVPRTEARDQATQDLVREIRGILGPEAKVGGDTAVLVDSKHAIGSRIPLAAGLIATTTFVLLFLFTGSVLQPLRALLFNVLTLGATLGVMVLIFQEGFLHEALGFTPLPLDTSMLMLLFCIAFGLSMDYEVFVISRVKEAYDHGADWRGAVTHGVSRTGRIVSAAAALLSISVFAFGTSGVSFIQMFGLGTGLAILIDATLARGILLPAAMRLLKDAAWWAPKPLRKLHGKVGLRESPSAEGAPAV